MVEGLDHYLAISEGIRGFTYGADSAELARVAYELPSGCTIVEVGAFFGRATVVLAGARKLRGSGKVHVIDAFSENVGDVFSVPYYREAVARYGGTVLENFLRSLDVADVADFVVMHIGMAQDLGRLWNRPIDLLYLTADESIAGAHELWSIYVPHVRRGGTVVLDNATDTNEPANPDCDGNRLLSKTLVGDRGFKNVRAPLTCVFAERV